MQRYIEKLFSQVSGEQMEAPAFDVLVLGEEMDGEFDQLKKECPHLPKGWLELSHLPQEDRVEFTRDFWIASLPFHLEAVEKVTRFFDSVVEIGVLLGRGEHEKVYTPHMIYVLKDEMGFFHGRVGANSDIESTLDALFPGTLFPPDYRAFLHIHDGFSKASDSGVIPTFHLQRVNDHFQTLINREPGVLTTKGTSVNPHSLIPFYESFGMPYFQCFWKDWYPENEMGNVYYSGNEHKISDPVDKVLAVEEMAFPTFMDWLFFYLEAVV